MTTDRDWIPGEITPQMLRRIGETLYGEDWQAPLANELGLTVRNVRRWRAGTSDTPVGLSRTLHGLILEMAEDAHSQWLELRALAAEVAALRPEGESK